MNAVWHGHDARITGGELRTRDGWNEGEGLFLLLPLIPFRNIVWREKRLNAVAFCLWINGLPKDQMPKLISSF